LELSIYPLQAKVKCSKIEIAFIRRHGKSLAKNSEGVKMRLIFVRHGHPNYVDDCLTDLGHLQAEAAAQRLCTENIDKIFTSSSGRAVETAEHIGSKLGIPCQKCDFMRELDWGSANGEEIPFHGQPWVTVNAIISRGEDVLDPQWMRNAAYQNNVLTQSVERVVTGFDPWLAELGYVREGNYYRVRESNPQTVVMVSHGGASTAALSRLFNLPFPFVCKSIQPQYTAISVITFNGETGALIAPTMELVNDAKHILGIEAQNIFGK
jgi:probable phosphoglycerate mutase